MKKYCAIDHLLVHVPERYESRIITKSGFEFFKDTVFSGISDTVRFGLVISVPEGHDYILEGDIVYFHHNITHEIINYNNQRERSNFVLNGTEGVYYIPMGQELIYAVERDGVFQALDGFCFVKDVLHETGFGELKTEHIGEMVYSPGSLTSLGIKKGDYVIMKFNADYPFKVYGDNLYRVRQKSILGKWIK